ncbi:hypothetical protein SAMN05444004_10774 [Jannaschia faecimaris]|uniref:Uncharacterized protein n=1 Tax=Jannaschia faecimaris TaxID=1244108 RepID=A0A1H3QZF8_9RHOB|nr:hypothetical protein [Jannaschia faecimaris]SDZ18435.1 hypothetical protein SAMN05444004_10774 [Jannaschia faecimaris]
MSEVVRIYRYVIGTIFLFSGPQVAMGGAAPPCATAMSTQMCLLDRAMVRAGSRSNPIDIAGVMNLIAGIAGYSGRVSMADFLPLLRGRLEERLPYGAIRLDVLRAQACNPFRSYSPGPIFAAEMIRQVEDLSRGVTEEDRRIIGNDLSIEGTVAQCLALMGDMAGVRDLIAANPGTTARIAARATHTFLRQNEGALARDLIAAHGDGQAESSFWFNRLPEPDFTIEALAEAGEIGTVFVAIQAVRDEAVRLWLLRFVMTRMDETAHKAQLVMVVEALSDGPDVALTPGMRFLVARVPVAAGDWSETLARLEPSEGSEDNGPLVNWTLVHLSGANGEYAVVAAMMERMVRDYSGSILGEAQMISVKRRASGR